jgi:asparagine synthase (glutamine-hydrolysing)
MCGIAGIFRPDGAPVPGDLVARMTEVLAHRGPDGAGLHVEGPVGLGHRRLAIIDLAAGAQPMGSDDGALWIAYNGEVYNFGVLRRELEARGVRFRTGSDTEVVLRGYEVWGTDVLPRLRGMFAFAIWDGRRRQMVLARDRLGIKPLVYAWDGASLRFGSEIKAILQDPSVPRELDWEALRDYLAHLYVPAPRTLFRAIRKLPPASYLVCRLDAQPEILRYWRLQPNPDPAVTETEWCRRLDEVLAETVRLHMVSDVPVGAFLSGGLDSSAVVAYMARASSTPVRTFSIGFDEADFDELGFARQVARRYGTDHFELVVKPEVMDILPRLAWQFDEPFADASALPTYCVARITREHVTVALSGDGGDENFAGYRRYAEAGALARLGDRPPVSLVRPLLRAVAGRLPENLRGRGFLHLLGLPPTRRYFRMMTFQTDETLRRLLTPEAAAGVGDHLDPTPYERLAAEAGGPADLGRLRYIDFHHYLPDDILAKVDRTSMLTSLETRVPLLDHVLVECVATIPEHLKFRDGRGKYIFRRTLEPLLPADILTRRKMGFGVPLGAWFRGQLKGFVSDILTDPQVARHGLLRPSAVHALLDAHARGPRDWSAQIWSLVCLELWCRTWWRR